MYIYIRDKYCNDGSVTFLGGLKTIQYDELWDDQNPTGKSDEILNKTTSF